MNEKKHVLYVEKNSGKTEWSKFRRMSVILQTMLAKNFHSKKMIVQNTLIK